VTYVTPKLVEKVVEHLRGDTTLTDLLGGLHIYKTRTLKKIQTPGVYWSRVSARPSENEVSTLLQFDIFTHTVELGFDIEAAIFALFHSDQPITLSGGYPVKAWLEEAHDEDDRDDTEMEGVQRVAVRYRFTQIREDM
jgi:hypothetical protein